MTSRKRSKSSSAGGGDVVVIEVPAGDAGFTDDFSLGITADDTSAAPTDVDTYAISLAQSDTVAAQTETVTLGLPAGNYGDSSAAPTDGNSMLVRVWLTGNAGTGVSNPSNADGQNDGATAVVQTAVAGPTTEQMLSPVGAAVPAGLTLSSVIYRGWFQSANTLVSSVGSLIGQSNGGLFTAFTMFGNSGLNITVNHLSGSFTFDLLAAGVNTSAKLSSLEIIHRTVDAAAGVQPHTLTVDAGAIDITGAFV